MKRYRLELDKEGCLGIYHKANDGSLEIWLGNIVEPLSANPVLALGTPLGVIGVRKILDLFKRWKKDRHPARRRENLRRGP